MCARTCTFWLFKFHPFLIEFSINWKLIYIHIHVYVCISVWARALLVLEFSIFNSPIFELKFLMNQRVIYIYICFLVFVFKIRRYVYHDVIRLGDADKLMDAGFVQVSVKKRNLKIFIFKVYWFVGCVFLFIKTICNDCILFDYGYLNISFFM